MGNFGKVIGKLYGVYVLKNLVEDVASLVGRSVRNIEFDKKAWLNRAGLTTYSPARDTVSGLSLFAVGLLAGGALGLALAPKRGAELRREVKDRAKDLIHRGTETIAESRARA